MRHSEFHRSHRIGWLRAAVLGANDGIVSTASLIIGIAAAHPPQHTVLFTGLAGLVSGTMAMAAGEYVSVSSQADTEFADLARERIELDNDHENELNELTHIYINRGLTKVLAHEVANQLTAHDALATHAREELGITEAGNARPIQAAIASAFTFCGGASLPLMVAIIAPYPNVIIYVAVLSLIFLASLGMIAAKVGGANKWLGALRVALWGALAMLATAIVGSLFGVVTA